MNWRHHYYPTWKDAVKAATGIELPKLKRQRRTKWSPEKIITEIRRLHEDGVPVTRDYLTRHGYGALVASASSKYYFGNWGNALKAAGIDRADIKREIKDVRSKRDEQLRPGVRQAVARHSDDLFITRADIAVELNVKVGDVSGLFSRDEQSAPVWIAAAQQTRKEMMRRARGKAFTLEGRNIEYVKKIIWKAIDCADRDSAMRGIYLRLIFMLRQLNIFPKGIVCVVMNKICGFSCEEIGVWYGHPVSSARAAINSQINRAKRTMQEIKADELDHDLIDYRQELKKLLWLVLTGREEALQAQAKPRLIKAKSADVIAALGSMEDANVVLDYFSFRSSYVRAAAVRRYAELVAASAENWEVSRGRFYLIRTNQDNENGRVSVAWALRSIYPQLGLDNAVAMLVYMLRNDSSKVLIMAKDSLIAMLKDRQALGKILTLLHPNLEFSTVSQDPDDVVFAELNILCAAQTFILLEVLDEFLLSEKKSLREMADRVLRSREGKSLVKKFSQMRDLPVCTPAMRRLIESRLRKFQVALVMVIILLLLSMVSAFAQPDISQSVQVEQAISCLAQPAL
ncbi:MAG: hypothetical protein NTY47_03330, partial [Candidatus Omnitrophica bacterium]|nr:hypothetical protein [Candidatus Omnitrophota bacterium]